MARKWITQSVLLSKERFPTVASARAWLLSHFYYPHPGAAPRAYKATSIEDSAVKPGGLPEGSGQWWRARQQEPTRGAVVRTLPLPGHSGVMFVRERAR